jgi:hypothetical protein
MPKKADANQPAIVARLRSIGGAVQHLHMVGGGCADLLVAFGGRWFVGECKSEKRTLTESQKRWHELFGMHAPVHVWRDPDEAEACVRGER